MRIKKILENSSSVLLVFRKTITREKGKLAALKCGFSILLIFRETMTRKEGRVAALKNELEIFIYGKTQEEEDRLFRSFNGMVQGGRPSLRKFPGIPRFRWLF